MTTSMKSSNRRLGYGDLSLENLRKTFQLHLSRTEIFSEIIPVEPAAWLKQVLQEGFEISVISEKARSEFIIASILLFIREMHQSKIGICSGTRFNIEPSRGLRGVCDFILGKGPVYSPNPGFYDS